jgi:hypothetical protein
VIENASVIERILHHLGLPTPIVPLQFMFFDFATRKSTAVMPPFEAPSGQGLTVSPDCCTMLYTIIPGRKSRLMVAESFR